ncbi:MAG: hypothetical protein CO108_19015 [Deltaproteobacteria bacterium CG_4_9_14_3_um_filter_63_12]|nr:MAG: hypothetical protein CO108_19015 [Deltaproteobacteria bacterium CG_4_9_14_3_um_filter_63_12]
MKSPWGPILLLTTWSALAGLLGSCVDGAGGSQTDAVSLGDTDSEVSVSCSDGIKNGNETDKDCGGSCGTWPQGAPASRRATAPRAIAATASAPLPAAATVPSTGTRPM